MLQNAAGQVFLAGRPQYLQTVPIVLGGQAADGTNPTSFLVKKCDVFVRNTTFSMRSSAQIAQNLLTFTMGVKTGSVAAGNLGGCDGGTFATSVSHIWSCNMGIYGSQMICSGGNFVFNNGAGADYMEFGGSIINHDGSPTFNMGTNDTFQNVFFMNSNCSSVRGATGAMFSNIAAASLQGSVLCLNNLQYFINASNRNTRKVKLSSIAGTPTRADIRSATAGTATEVIWSGNAPVRVSNGGLTPLTGFGEYWGFDVKIVNPDGEPLSGVPIYLESDLDPAGLLSTTTNADGNIVFTEVATQVDNNVLVRNHYGTSLGTDTGTLVADRVFTITVNGYADPLVTPLSTWETRIFKFEWPGRDRTESGYATDGGTFKIVLGPIRLGPGTPTRNPIYEECEVP